MRRIIGKKYFWFLVVLCFVFTLSTASADGLKIDSKVRKNLPTTHKIEGMEFISQGSYPESGAACIAMVLKFWGVDVSVNEVYEEVKDKYSPHFSFCGSMIQYPKKYTGLNTDFLVGSDKGSQKNLKYFLYKGYPLIAFTTPRKDSGYSKEGHYVVVVGYNEEGFYIVCPKDGEGFLTNKEFRYQHSMRWWRSWGGCGPFLTLIIYPEN